MIHLGCVPTTPNQSCKNGWPGADENNIERITLCRVVFVSSAAGLRFYSGLKCRHIVDVFDRRVEVVEIDIFHICVEPGNFNREREIKQLFISQ